MSLISLAIDPGVLETFCAALDPGVTRRRISQPGPDLQSIPKVIPRVSRPVLSDISALAAAGVGAIQAKSRLNRFNDPADRDAAKAALYMIDYSATEERVMAHLTSKMAFSAIQDFTEEFLSDPYRARFDSLDQIRQENEDRVQAFLRRARGWDQLGEITFVDEMPPHLREFWLWGPRREFLGLPAPVTLMGQSRRHGTFQVHIDRRVLTFNSERGRPQEMVIHPGFLGAPQDRITAREYYDAGSYAFFTDYAEVFAWRNLFTG